MTFRDRPWYVQLLVGAAVGLIAITLASWTGLLRADGSTLGLHDPLRPAQRTCDDPENPCYTQQQMERYFAHGTHGFKHLNPRYVFPIELRHAAIRAHRHGVARGLIAPYVATVDAPTWWGSFRSDIHCAGGTAKIYWGCPGGVNEAEVEAMDLNLSRTQRVVFFCGTLGMVAFIRGGPTAAIGGGGSCFLAAWLGI